MSYSQDHFGNLVVEVENEGQAASLVTELIIRDNSFNAIFLKLRGKACGDVKELCSDHGFIVRGYVNDYLELMRWMRLDRECNIPPLFSARIGVLGIVSTMNRKVLLVKEKFGPAAGKFKFLTGSVASDEDPHLCILREIEEEVGLTITTRMRVRLLGVHIDKNVQPGIGDHCYIFSIQYNPDANQADLTEEPLRIDPVELEAAEFAPIESIYAREDVTTYTKILLRSFLLKNEQGQPGFMIDKVNRGPRILTTYD